MLHRIIVQILKEQNSEVGKEFIIKVARGDSRWKDERWTPSGAWIDRELRRMANAGIIEAVRKGRRVYYRLPAPDQGFDDQTATNVSSGS